MGQLEKYGLYVLCLVIFLILGVTIWGGGDLPQGGRRPAPTPSTELHAGRSSSNGAGLPQNGESQAGPSGDVLAGIEELTGGGKKGEGKAADAVPPGNGGGNSGNSGSSSNRGNAVDASNGGPAAKEGVAPPVVEADTKRGTHKVAAGDTFEGIAKAEFGSAALRSEIARLNPKVEPTRMRVGQELVLPSKAEAAAILGKVVGETKAADKRDTKTPIVPAIAGNSTYTVVKGDTFEGIAIRQLGSRSRLDDLRQANPGVDPVRIKVGQKIQLPKK